MRSILAPVVLGLTYLVVIGTCSAADVVTALAIGAVVTVVAARSPLIPSPQTVRALAGVPWFVWGISIEIFQGSWQMLLVLLGVRTWKTIGYVELPFGERSVTGARVNALVATMSPGSVLVDVNETDEMMLFNVIDAENPDRFRHSMDIFYRRYQKPVIQ